MLGLVALFILFTAPGFLILRSQKFEGKIEKLFFLTLASFVLVGFFAQAIGLFFSITPLILYLSAAALIVLVWPHKKELLDLFHFKTIKLERQDKIILFVLVFLLSLSAATLMLVPDKSYDSLSYHLPLIDDFAEDGRFSFYGEPENVFHLRTNYYPKLFETIVGLFKGFSSTPFWKILPALMLAYAIGGIYFISKLLKSPSLLGGLFFISSLIVFMQSTIFYADIFTTALTLAAVFFIFKSFEKSNKRTLAFAGLFLGGVLATKFTGPLIVLAVILFQFAKRRKLDEAFYLCLPAAIVGSMPYLSTLFSGTEMRYVVGYPAQLLSNNIAQGIALNLYRSAELLGQMLIVGHFFILIPILFFAGFFHNKLKGFNRATIIFFLALVMIPMGLTETGPQYYDLPRFIFPAVALMCVGAGIYGKNHAKLMGGGGRLFSIILMGLLLVNTVTIISHSESMIANSKNAASIYSNLIPNEKSTKTFYANTGHPIVYGLERTRIVDFYSYRNIDAIDCEFLKSDGVSHVVIFYPHENGPEFKNTEFITKIRQELIGGKCGNELYKSFFVRIYKI